jgi:hypothetical protein
MQAIRKVKLLSIATFIFIFAAMLFMPLTVNANAGSIAEIDILSVDEFWLDGETLHVTVTDINTGISHTYELDLRDYVDPSDEFVIIQATDRDGNISNPVQFRNPFFCPDAKPPETSDDDEANEPDVPDVPIYLLPEQVDTNPFTPDGTGSVVDNATEDDGKEFFTISTEDGNIFHLVIDRQRNIDNVYLLSAVTELDLISLAKPGDGSVPTLSPAPVETQEPELLTAPEPEPKQESGGNGSIIFILIAVAAIGGAAYYIKIVRPKKEAFDDDDDGYGAEYGEDDDFSGDKYNEEESFDSNDDSEFGDFSDDDPDENYNQ